MLWVVLREQIEKLKSHTALTPGIDDVTSETHREIAWLREQLMNKEAEMAEINRCVFNVVRYELTILSFCYHNN